jgi:hypothetical protein
MTNLGIFYMKAERLDEARSLLRRALEISEGQAGDPTHLAQTRFALARALWTVKAERAHARSLAFDARETYAEAQGLHAAELREVDRWLRMHRL